MGIRIYLIIWFICTAIIGFEYYALNFNQHLSILLWAQAHGMIAKATPLNYTPGRPVSLWLGWAGLSLMLIMNVYSLRKKLHFMHNWGKISSWLNFHIFCGLLGPSMIFFHCNFKVRGVVAISFWSMITSFTSGIVGKYFYVQISRLKSEFQKDCDKRLVQLEGFLKKNNILFEENDKKILLERVYHYVGIPSNTESINPLMAFAYTIVGDLRLMMALPAIPLGWPIYTRQVLKEIGVNRRKAVFVSSFQHLMGYWHTFHFPFAIFMYIAAVIHVAAALIFGV